MERKSKMFSFGGKPLRTYNPVFGCEHHCYRDGCWAKVKIASRVGAGIGCDLCAQFKYHTHLDRKVSNDPRIFVVAHGDLFGSWVPPEIISRVLKICRENPREMYFFETKNPRRYEEFIEQFPANTVLSCTIETNRIYNVEIRGRGPPPDSRYWAMLELRSFGFPIHISIEPILDFDLQVLVHWMQELKPFRVSIGYDSLKNSLPEPFPGKTLKLIKELEKFTDVERKHEI